MRTKLSGKADIKFEVGRILSHILGHPVQLLYSACGKESKVSGKVTKKLNFSKTYTYTYMLGKFKIKIANATFDISNIYLLNLFLFSFFCRCVERKVPRKCRHLVCDKSMAVRSGRPQSR